MEPPELPEQKDLEAMLAGPTQQGQEQSGE
jgi:hypothetical protein